LAGVVCNYTNNVESLTPKKKLLLVLLCGKYGHIYIINMPMEKTRTLCYGC